MMESFRPVAFKAHNYHYLFWDIGNSCEYYVTRGSYNLKLDTIDNLYRWVEQGDYDKDFDTLAIFPSLEKALDVAKKTI